MISPSFDDLKQKLEYITNIHSIIHIKLPVSILGLEETHGIASLTTRMNELDIDETEFCDHDTVEELFLYEDSHSQMDELIFLTTKSIQNRPQLIQIVDCLLGNSY